MADNSQQKYSSTENIKRSVDKILKSDQYTDEYKRIILEKLGINYSAPKTELDTEDVPFDLLKNGSIIIKENELTGGVTITDKPAAVSGYLEKPEYLEDALMKAIDVVVDELISPPPKEAPLTVPKPVYDALNAKYAQAIADIEDLRIQLNNALSELESAKLLINVLNQTVDSEKLLRAAADNETQAANERFIALLKDFQIAMQKGIQEAIQRVSLTAQVQGLQAQKEVLQQQLDNLKTITENLQQQVEVQQDTISDQQEAAAAAFLLTGPPGSYDKTNKSGWKLPESNIKDISVVSGKTIYYRKGKGWINGNQIDFYNLSEEPLVFTFTYVKVSREDVDRDKDKLFISGPASITVPARVKSDPGIVTVEFQKINNHTRKTFHIGRMYDDIKVQVSNGDTYTINAYYRLRED